MSRKESENQDQYSKLCRRSIKESKIACKNFLEKCFYLCITLHDYGLAFLVKRNEELNGVPVQVLALYRMRQELMELHINVEPSIDSGKRVRSQISSSNGKWKFPK